MTVELGMLCPAHPHAGAYAEVIEGLSGVELTAVCDENRSRGLVFADRHDVPLLPTTEALETVDGAIVCAPTTRHQRWIERAAAVGVPVLSEKPLANSADEAAEIVECCEDTETPLGVAMPVRFSQPARRAKAIVEAGELGDIRAYVGTNLLQRLGAGSWLTDPELAGGGAIVDHSVHVTDLVRWLSGSRITEVFAETGSIQSDIAVEELNVLSMALEDGTPVTHDGSWCLPDEHETWGDVTLRIFGTEGVLEIDCFDQTIGLTRDGGTAPGQSAVFWGTDMNEGLLADFADAIQEDRPPAITGRDSLNDVAVIDAAYRSIETGSPVSIE